MTYLVECVSCLFEYMYDTKNGPHRCPVCGSTRRNYAPVHASNMAIIVELEEDGENV